VLTHSGGVEYAETIAELDFSVVDPFAVWSVYADYGKHQVCIGEARPVPPLMMVMLLMSLMPTSKLLVMSMEPRSSLVSFVTD